MELSSEPAKLSDVQAGRIGEYLLAVYAMLTSSGELVPFHVEADDDHRDLVVAAKGKSAFASLLAKACFELGASGFVQSNATYFESSISTDPSWIYVVVLVLELAPVVWWLVPAPDFNRLTSRAGAPGPKGRAASSRPPRGDRRVLPVPSRKQGCRTSPARGDRVPPTVNQAAARRTSTAQAAVVRVLARKSERYER